MVIVDGGIIGAACVPIFHGAGMAVTLVDQGPLAAAARTPIAARLSQPRAADGRPGAVTMGLKALVARNSPLKIHPRLDPAMELAVAVQPLLQCPASTRGWQSDPVAAGLVRELYDEWFATERIECEWEAKGLLFVFQSAAAFEHYATTDELMCREFGPRARRLAAGELAAFEPA